MDMGTGLQIPFCEIKVQRGRALLEATQHTGGRTSEPGRALMEHMSPCTCREVVDEEKGPRWRGSQLHGGMFLGWLPWLSSHGPMAGVGWWGPGLSPLPSLATHLKAL